MKKLYSLFMLLIIILLFHTMLYAQIQGSGMGLISTVTAEGAFDITRNPALLGTITKSKASFYVMGSPYYNEENTLQFKVSGVNINSVTQTNDYYYELSLYAGLAIPLSYGTLGISISSSDEKLFIKRKDTMAFLFENGAQKNITETQEIHPQLTCSYGFKTTTQSFGFQLKVTPFQKSINNHKQITSLAPYYFYYDFIQKDSGVDVQPLFGFLTFVGNAQIGFSLIPSTFTAIKKNAKTDIPDNFIGYNTSFSSSWRFQQTKGPTFAMGAYIPLFSFMGMAFESAFSMPSTYSITNTDTFETNLGSVHYIPITNTTVSIHNHPVIALKGGIRIVISQAFDITSGIAYLHLSNDSFADTLRANSDNNIYIFTCGGNYTISQKITASLFFIATRAKIESNHEQEKILNPSFNATLKQDIINSDIGFAISYNL